MDPSRDPLPFAAPPPDHDWPRYAFRGLHADGGVCRLRVWRHVPPVPVVIATELPENDNTSVTDIAEHLAAEVLVDLFPHAVGEDRPLVWIEHHPAGERRGDEFSRVDFAHWRPAPALQGGVRRHKLGEPTWRHLEPAEVAALIAGEGAG
jgi:hypothetical protein